MILQGTLNLQLNPELRSSLVTTIFLIILSHRYNNSKESVYPHHRKSTIVRLLYRFYDPCQGTVFVGGKPLTDMTLESYRKAIGVVPQDCVLFNEDIHYNIKVSDPRTARKWLRADCYGW